MKKLQFQDLIISKYLEVSNDWVQLNAIKAIRSLIVKDKNFSPALYPIIKNIVSNNNEMNSIRNLGLQVMYIKDKEQTIDFIKSELGKGGIISSGRFGATAIQYLSHDKTQEASILINDVFRETNNSDVFGSCVSVISKRNDFESVKEIVTRFETYEDDYCVTYLKDMFDLFQPVINSKTSKSDDLVSALIASRSIHKNEQIESIKVSVIELLKTNHPIVFEESLNFVKKYIRSPEDAKLVLENLPNIDKLSPIRKRYKILSEGSFLESERTKEDRFFGPKFRTTFKTNETTTPIWPKCVAWCCM